jgi:hypothetical protein
VTVWRRSSARGRKVVFTAAFLAGRPRVGQFWSDRLSTGAAGKRQSFDLPIDRERHDGGPLRHGVLGIEGLGGVFQSALGGEAHVVRVYLLLDPRDPVVTYLDRRGEFAGLHQTFSVAPSIYVPAFLEGLPAK